MQRLFWSLRALPTTFVTPLRFSRPALQTIPVRAFGSERSAPKAAEKASAQSGGSRSKDAVEAETGTGPQGGAVPDGLATGDARGRTGGGEPLKSSEHAPPQPKIFNAQVSIDRKNDMTDEQQAEVEAHNRDFESKHDRAESAAEDKVDKKFWQGGGNRSEEKM